MQHTKLLIFLIFFNIAFSEEVKSIVKLPDVDVEINWNLKKPFPNTSKVQSFCKKIDKEFLKLGWGESKCEYFKWNHVRNSVLGDPLMWVAFGNEHKNEITTIILCGVHGDEITPNKFCFDVLFHLERYSELYKNHLIIVAPIVSPDGFFAEVKTRTNSRDVDVNRNFPTKDWKKDALRLWKGRYGSDKRRFPGNTALSEPEVVFQVNLIKRYSPDKIISVHAPLTLIDYDGPSIEKGKSNNLLMQMSESANGYKITDYPVFPGSLGNWAGYEMGIPTFTLELPSSDNRKHKEYWELFRNAIHSAFFKDLRKDLAKNSKK